MLVGAVFKYYPYDAEDLENSLPWKWRIRFQKTVFKLQILPRFDMFLKKRIEVIEEINPVMKITLCLENVVRSRQVENKEKIRDVVYAPCQTPK